MRRAVLAIVVVFVILLVLGVVVGQSLAVGQRIAHVSGLSGEVAAQPPRGGDFQPLADGTNVLAGTTIKTGPAGTVTLNWIDGTRIRLGSNAIMTVLKCQINRNNQAETSLFRLQIGELLVRVRKALSGQSKFEIQTPTATAGVRGTIFAVRVDRVGETKIEVIEGQVRVNAQGRELDLAAGTKGTAGTGGTTVEKLTSEEQAAWERHRNQLGPYLLVTSPTAGAKVAGNTVEVKGQVEKGAQVTVQGEPVQVNEGNRWATMVQIPPGSKQVTVTVTAKDERGYETSEVREVSVGP